MELVSIFVLAVGLGFAIGFICSRSSRRIALGTAFLVPPLLVFAVGLSNGCAGEPSGEQCFGYGFGLAFAALVLPIWVILIFAGKWLKSRYCPSV